MFIFFYSVYTSVSLDVAQHFLSFCQRTQTDVKSSAAFNFLTFFHWVLTLFNEVQPYIISLFFRVPINEIFLFFSLKMITTKKTTTPKHHCIAITTKKKKQIIHQVVLRSSEDDILKTNESINRKNQITKFYFG